MAYQRRVHVLAEDNLVYHIVEHFQERIGAMPDLLDSFTGLRVFVIWVVFAANTDEGTGFSDTHCLGYSLFYIVAIADNPGQQDDVEAIIVIRHSMHVTEIYELAVRDQIESSDVFGEKTACDQGGGLVLG